MSATQVSSSYWIRQLYLMGINLKLKARSKQKVLAFAILYQMQLFSKSFADMVLIEREETREKRGGKGMAEGGGDRLGGTEMMDGVSEREP